MKLHVEVQNHHEIIIDFESLNHLENPPVLISENLKLFPTYIDIFKI